MEQEVRFCTMADGARIAYAVFGTGPPLVYIPGWVSHLELTWERNRVGLDLLGEHFTVVRYDKRGTGLSDRDVKEISPEASLRDFEALLQYVELDRLSIFGVSEGGPLALSYAAVHPDGVEKLVLYGTFAFGEAVTGTKETAQALATLVRAEWGLASTALTDLFMPGASTEDRKRFALDTRLSAEPEVAARLLESYLATDLRALLPQVKAPTLVVHARGDRVVPLELGRDIAARIPGARLHTLETDRHAISQGPDIDLQLWSVWFQFLTGQGLAHVPPRTTSLETAEVASGDPPKAEDTRAATAHDLLAPLESVRLSRYAVVGNYSRFQERDRQTLKDAYIKIAGGLRTASRSRENHLIWAAPGSGKTYFVQETARALADLRYIELNLAKVTQDEFRTALSSLNDSDQPALCLVDEADAKPEEPWPYEVLLPYLDARAERGKPWVFVLAGSSGTTLAEMKERISDRPKGADLLSRIPGTNEYVIPPLGAGDQLVVALSQVRQAGAYSSRPIGAIEKLALYYVALAPGLTNARQLRECIVRAVERVPGGDDRLRYDHLFSPGDPENKQFWVRYQPLAANLADRFLLLED